MNKVDYFDKINYLNIERDTVLSEQKLSKEKQLLVSGMSRAACATRIEKTLASLEGVSRASVNFADSRATLEFDPREVNLTDFVQAVESIGYHAEGASDADPDREEELCSKEIRGLSLLVSIQVPLERKERKYERGPVKS